MLFRSSAPVQIQGGRLVTGVLPTIAVNSPPATVSSSPLTVTGTASSGSGIAQVTWSNAATGGSGTATGTTSWSAVIPLAPGSNAITVTAIDGSGNSNSTTFVVDDVAPIAPSPSPGGGGHGGCGATGLEMLLAGILLVFRRRRRSG